MMTRLMIALSAQPPRSAAGACRAAGARAQAQAAKRQRDHRLRQRSLPALDRRRGRGLRAQAGNRALPHSRKLPRRAARASRTKPGRTRRRSSRPSARPAPTAARRSGPGGFTGCLTEQINQARRERERSAAERRPRGVNVAARQPSTRRNMLAAPGWAVSACALTRGEPMIDRSAGAADLPVDAATEASSVIPKGLAYLAFTEMWERFSYYGMTALLALYMVKQLLLPGPCRACARASAACATCSKLRGPMSDAGFRLADLRLVQRPGLFHAGARRDASPTAGSARETTVVLGALLMSAGHLAMAFDQSFLVALLLLIVGSGCLKGNISAQVGQLYPRDDEIAPDAAASRSSRPAINVGAVLGPLGCGARRRRLWLARRVRARRRR